MTQRIEPRAVERQEAAAHPMRWPIALAAAVMQGAVGATYAWSVFRDPLAAEYGWTIPEVTLAYSLNLFSLGIFAFVGGLWMRRVGPRTVGIVAGLLYGLGLMLAGLAGDRLWALYLGFGVVAGVGRGLGWVVPMAMVVKWFPDRRGLITGVSLAGNGLGALIAAPLAAGLIESIGVLPTFTVSGLILLALVAGPALAMREPPDAYCPAGWSPSATSAARSGSRELTPREALRTPQWIGLWGLLFLSSTAGLALFSHAAPMAQELTGVGALAAAGVVAVVSVANVVGRVWWAWLSDMIGPRLVFTAILVLLAAVLRLLPRADGLAAFAGLAAVVMLCFGGGLGTMPAFAADYFGPKHVGPIMGLLMTAQGTAAMFGPMLLASARETSGSYVPALSALAVLLALSVALPLALRPPGRPASVARVPVVAHVARSLLPIAALVWTVGGIASGPMAHASEAVPFPATPRADLAIIYSASGVQRVALPLTYAVGMTNRGAGSASNVRVTVLIPGTTRFESTSSSQGRCRQESEAVTCTLDAPLAPGGTAAIAVRVTPWSPGMIESTAHVVADEPDPVAANNSASITTSVFPRVDGRVSPSPTPSLCPSRPRPMPRTPNVNWLHGVDQSVVAREAAGPLGQADDRLAIASERYSVPGGHCNPV